MEQPQRIGDYEVLGKLGSGGMGEVYKVRNVISDRIEAMKVLLPDLVGRQDLAARFLREIKVLAALHHPNIAALRTALTADNQLVMIMEFVEGQSLSRRVARGPIPPADALHYLDQVLDALDYAHRQQVVHRDIKPANMMLTPQGVVKLTDFGIARSANDPTLTVAGATTGSLSYMSPEQINGQTTDARSDLYSLGVSLYEMLTGRVPFKADTGFAVMLAHLNDPPKPPLELLPSLSPELNQLVLKAIAKDPSERFQSAAEFRAALKQAGPADRKAAVVVPPLPASVAAAAVSAPPPSANAAPARPAPAAAAQQDPWMATRRNRISPLVYVALGAFLVVGGVAGMAYYSRSAEANPSAAKPATTPSSSPLRAADVPPIPALPAPAPAAPLEATSSANPVAPVASGPSPAAPGPVTPGPGNAGPGRPTPASPGTGPTRLVEAQPRPAAPRRPAPAEPAPAEAAAAPAAPAASTQALLDELELEIDRLDARAAAVNASLDRLKQDQARMGYGLRGDMAARQQSMNINFSKAAEAVDRKDLARAQRFKGMAEDDLAVLEKFLGR